MDETFRAKIDLAVQHAITAGREEIVPINKNKKAPTRGNLRYNATKEARTGEYSWEISVSGNGKEGIAPYAPFTNEPWLAARWHSKKNPNQGWFQRLVEFVAKDLAKTLGGELIIETGEEDDDTEQ